MSEADNYDVVQTEEDEDDEAVTSERVLGVVTMDRTGMLTIVSAAAAADDDTLETIVEEMNEETTLHEEAQPPEGALKFEVYTRAVERGTPEFVPAMLDHLKRYFDIELRPRR